MNGNETIEGLWLLVDSGEATPAQQAELEELLEANPAAAAGIAELEWVCRNAAEAPLVPDGPSQATLDAVMAAAAARPRRKRHLRLITFSTPAVRVLAYAAAAAIVISGWLAIIPGKAASAAVNKEDVQALLLVVAKTDTDAGTATQADNLGSLADQLLEFQGFGGSSLLEDELLSFLQEDEPSTAPQARRTPGSPAEICG